MTTTHTTYTTRTEAIEREIVEALGDYADEFMIDAIADEVLEWIDGRGANPYYPTATWLPAQGYRLSVDTREFWDVVQRHAVDGEGPDGYDEAEAVAVAVEAGSVVELGCAHLPGAFTVKEVCDSGSLVVFSEERGWLVVSRQDVAGVL